MASTGFAGSRARASSVADAARDRRALVVGVFLLALATLFVYWDVWRFELVNFDDAIALGGAERIVGDRSADAIAASRGAAPAGRRDGALAILRRVPRAFVYQTGREFLPIRDLSYAVEYLVCGGWHPGCLHTTNLLLHLVNGALVVGLAAQLGVGAAGAILTGSVFLLHPIQAESVAWIASRKDLLAAFFVLLSWHAHARGQRTLSAIAFLAAGLSKATVVLFPAVLIASSVLIERARVGAALRRVAPHAVIAVFVASLQLRSAGEAGMLARARDADPLASLLLAAKLPLLYLRNLAWPSRLHLLYAPTMPVPSAIGSWIATIALVLVAAIAIRTARARPLVIVGLAAFALFLAPTLGLVPFQLLMADRYAYLALGGLALAFAAMVGRAGGVGREAVAYAPLLLAVPLALVARGETLAWRDSETIWRREIARDPARTEAWANLGEHYLLRGRPADAADALARAARLRPESHEILTNYALAAARAGRRSEAAAAIDSAVARAPNDPLVRYNAACVRAQAGETDAALAELAEAIHLGFSKKESIRSDPDLDSIRNDPRFKQIAREILSEGRYVR